MLAPIPAGIPQYAKGGPIPQGPLPGAIIMNPVDTRTPQEKQKEELAKFGANLAAQPGGSLTQAIGSSAAKSLEGLTRIEEAKRLEEQRRLEELRRIEEQRRLDEERRLAEERRVEEERRMEELRRIEEQKRREAQIKAEEERRLQIPGLISTKMNAINSLFLLEILDDYYYFNSLIKF